MGTPSATIPDLGEARWPRSFGRYVLLRPIAQGGMGEVCLALLGALQNAQRLCVIKTVRPEFAHEPAFIERFLDEGRMLCALNHPNIAQVLEVGIESTTAFMALEHVAGLDLDLLLAAARDQRSELSCEFVVNLMATVLDGVSFAHEARALDGSPLELIHRDLSPQNLRISWEGDAKILDFGTAYGAHRSVKTAQGVVFGKPGYMSPEQCRGHALDPRSDLFALGIIAWEALSGRDFAGTDGPAHMSALSAGKTPFPKLSSLRSGVPAGFEAWLDRMTALHREERFSSATAARRALFHLSRELGYALDRGLLSTVISSLFPGEREADRERIRRLMATAATQSPVSPVEANGPRGSSTEVMPITKAMPTHGTRYRVGARLGAGGMGEVFAAEHIDLGRTVAMKILYADQSNDPGVAQRFRLEARAIASLSHPNLVHVYDFGTTDDGRLFYAMERLLGETLRDRLERSDRLSTPECVRIGIAVARGLSAAHEVSLVHRDIKPENIFLTDTGIVKVLDFGIAKTTNASFLGAKTNAPRIHATRQGEICGTPAYMAPEQVRGASDADARTDLYALGAVLYECTAGVEVFTGRSLVELLAQHLAEPAKPLSSRVPELGVPAAYEAVIMRCLAKNPDDRPQSARELIAALEESIAPPEPVLPPSREAVALARPTPVAIPVTRRSPIESSARARKAPSNARWGPPLAALSGVLAVLALLNASGRLSRDSARADSGRALTRLEHTVTRQGTAPALPTPTPPTPTAPPTEPAVHPLSILGDSGALGAQHPEDSGRLMPRAARDSGAPRARGGQESNHFVLAQRALDARQYHTAIAQAESAIELGQGGQRARNLLGLAYMRDGRRLDAVRAWRMVLAREPDNHEALGLLRMAGEGP